MTSPRAVTALPTAGVLVLVVALGVNLRALFGALPPLVPEIRSDLGLSATTAGLLTSGAVLLMGLCAPLGQHLARHLGQEPAMLTLLTALGVAGVSRLWIDSAALLVLTAAAIGAAMGALSSLVPAFIAVHLPRIRGTATGLFSTSMALGVGLAAALTQLLADALGGWRASLACWGVLALAVAAVMLALLPRLRVPRRQSANTESDPVAAPVGPPPIGVWLVAAMTSVMMLLGFSTVAWLAPALEDSGMTPGRATTTFVVFQGVQLFSMLSLPPLTDVLPGKRLVFAIVLTTSAAGLLMLAVAPSSLALPAALLGGFGIGGGSSLALVLIQHASRTREEANRISAISMLFAFTAGGVGPLLLGLLRDTTGSFALGWTVLLVLCLAAFALLVPLRDRPSTPGVPSRETACP